MSEPPGGPPVGVQSVADQLIAEACQRSGLVWLRAVGTEKAGGERTTPTQAHPAWHVWHDGALLVVGGPGEQPLPPLQDAVQQPVSVQQTSTPDSDAVVEVIVRSKEAGSRLVTFRAHARLLPPGTTAWDDAAAALKAGRLNAPDADNLLRRWAEQGQIFRLEPQGAPSERPGSYDDASLAAPPPVTTATTLGRQPFHLGRRKRRRR